MEATCKNCNHWEHTEAQQDNLGECDVLGAESGSNMFVLPVINNETQTPAHILTKANFGCNQFSAE